MVVSAQLFPLLDKQDRLALTFAEIQEYNVILGSVAAVALLVWTTTFIATIAWLSRSVENAPSLRGGTPRWSPRWSIAWWFAPIGNLFMPALVIRDLARRIGPDGRGRDVRFPGARKGFPWSGLAGLGPVGLRLIGLHLHRDGAHAHAEPFPLVNTTEECLEARATDPRRRKA